MTEPIHQAVSSGSSGAGSDRRRDPLLEVVIVYATVVAATYVLTRFRNEYVHLLVGVLYLMLPFRLAQREAGGPRRFGIDLAGVLAPPEGDPPESLVDRFRHGATDLVRAIRGAIVPAFRELGAAGRVIVTVFPVYAVGFWWWTAPTHSFHLYLREDWFSFAATQLIVVALPEETLFRGYFQTRLTDEWPTERKILGVRLSLKAWLGQAALFGVIHALVDHNPARLSVFFPGLLFGWMRAWRGGIGAAMVLHAASNLLEELLEHGWLR